MGHIFVWLPHLSQRFGRRSPGLTLASNHYRDHVKGIISDGIQILIHRLILCMFISKGETVGITTTHTLTQKRNVFFLGRFLSACFSTCESVLSLCV